MPAHPITIELVLSVIPRFNRCCCSCFTLRTGCIIIGTVEVITGLLAVLVQLFFVVVCFKYLDTVALLGQDIADTVSYYADDYCAGLSTGYLTGSIAYTAAGVMLIVAIRWDVLSLLRIWLYLMVFATCALFGCYMVAIYALVSFPDDRELIAVPSVYELLISALMFFCMSIVKSYYLNRQEKQERVKRRSPRKARSLRKRNISKTASIEANAAYLPSN